MNDAQWRSLLSRGHRAVTRVELWHNGLPRFRNFPVLDGQVDLDGEAEIQRSFSCTATARARAMLPTTPGVTELRPYRGLIHRREEKLWPLGVFRVTSDSISHSRSALDYKIETFDLSRTLNLNRLSEPFTTQAGRRVEDVIEKLLSKALTGLKFSWPEESAGQCPTLLFQEGEKPWQRAQKLYAQFGHELVIDATNRIVGRVPQAIDTSTALTLTPRELLVVTVERSDDPGYNGIKVVGEPDDAPAVRSYMWDDDPSSPTYFRGPYGPRVRFYKSKFIRTQQQADLTARRLFQATVGPTFEASFSTFVDPTLQPSSVVALQDPAISLDARFTAQAFGIPLSVDGDMSVRTAKLRNGVTATDLPEAAE